MEPQRGPRPEQLAQVQIPVVPVFEYQAILTPSREEIAQAEHKRFPDPRVVVADRLTRLSRDGYADQVIAMDTMILVGEQVGFWIAPQPTIQPAGAMMGGFIECRRKRS